MIGHEEAKDLARKKLNSKPAPADGELGKALELATGLTKIEIDEAEYPLTTTILFKTIIKPLAKNFLALHAAHEELLAQARWRSVEDELPEAEITVELFIEGYIENKDEPCQKWATKAFGYYDYDSESFRYEDSDCEVDSIATSYYQHSESAVTYWRIGTPDPPESKTADD